MSSNQKIPVFVERTPLFDLDDVLLGYSCRAVVSKYYVEEHPDETAATLGMRNPRGFISTLDPRDRCYTMEWFEPFMQYTPW